MRQQIEQAMNNPDEWKDPLPEKPRRSEKRQRSVMISVRLNSDEAASLEWAASARGWTISRFVRDMALECAALPVVTTLTS